jgi:flagellar protein FliJ
MPFKFRLKPLLRHREFKLNEARTALASAESFKMEIQSHIDGLRENMRAESEQFEREQESGISAACYLNFKNYLELVERELVRFQKELEKADREVHIRQQAVIESNKSLKLVENIESREKEVYDYEMSRRDQKKVDEAAVLKDYRDRGPGGRREEQCEN